MYPCAPNSHFPHPSRVYRGLFFFGSTIKYILQHYRGDRIAPHVNLCSYLYLFSSVWFFVESSACNFSVVCTHRTFLELHNPLPSSINQPQPSCHLQNVWPAETERRLWIRLQKLTNNERRRFASTLMAGQSPNPNKGSERSANSRRVVKFWAGFKFERVSQISP